MDGDDKSSPVLTFAKSLSTSFVEEVENIVSSSLIGSADTVSWTILWPGILKKN